MNHDTPKLLGNNFTPHSFNPEKITNIYLHNLILGLYEDLIKADEGSEAGRAKNHWFSDSSSLCGLSNGVTHFDEPGSHQPRPFLVISLTMKWTQRLA